MRVNSVLKGKRNVIGQAIYHANDVILGVRGCLLNLILDLFTSYPRAILQHFGDCLLPSRNEMFWLN